MSRYTYAGNFENPTENYLIEQIPDTESESAGLFRIAVKVFCECGAPCCSHPQIGTRPHTSAPIFEDYDEAYEWLENLEETFERDYDDYLEENHHDIVQMELYELWRREY